MPARFNWYNKYTHFPALLTMLSTCLLQVRLFEIVTPNMLACSTLSSTCSPIVTLFSQTHCCAVNFVAKQSSLRKISTHMCTQTFSEWGPKPFGHPRLISRMARDNLIRKTLTHELINNCLIKGELLLTRPHSKQIR